MLSVNEVTDRGGGGGGGVQKTDVSKTSFQIQLYSDDALKTTLNEIDRPC